MMPTYFSDRKSLSFTYHQMKKAYPLYPNKEAMTTDEDVPVPIESVFFLEDGVQDNHKRNRYYFDFPAEWHTANLGESIIGVRCIWLMPRRRNVKFTLGVRKYYSTDSIVALTNNPKWTRDQVFQSINWQRKSEIFVNVISWIPVDADLREVWRDLRKSLIPAFQSYNEKIRKEKAEADPKATPQDQRPEFTLNESNCIDDNDVQMDGYYDYTRNCFVETFYAPSNGRVNDMYKEVVHTDLSVQFDIRPFSKAGKQDNTINIAYDFVDLFNVGKEAYQNPPEMYLTYETRDIGNEYQSIIVRNAKWSPTINFYDVWDRNSCKVYSSIAEQSNHNYLGNSQIYFSPIKYYKVNATDQRFWIEFYSGRHNKIPIKLPLNESFYVEMQFLPYRKMLYI